MAPVIPFLGDHPDQLRATVRAIAASGATSVTPLVLHLRPGRARVVHGLARRSTTRIWCGGTSGCTRTGAYAPTWYQRRITRQVHELAAEYGIGPARRGEPRRIPVQQEQQSPLDGPGPTQLTLL